MVEHHAEAEPHPVEPELMTKETPEDHFGLGTSLPIVLRILDNENRLAERADQKAISLLSVLGVFMVFFVVYYRFIPINPLTVVMMTTYVAAAFLAIMHLILTIRPRIQSSQESLRYDNANTQRPEFAFFAGICRYPTLESYEKALTGKLQDEAQVAHNYIRQIYNVAHINQLKYRYVQRAAVIVLLALGIELTIIAYLFAVYIGEGNIG